MPEEDRNRVFNIQKEKSSYEDVKDKLRLENNEIDKLKKNVRVHAEEREKFERMKGLWELEKNPNPELINSQANSSYGPNLQSKKQNSLGWSIPS